MKWVGASNYLQKLLFPPLITLHEFMAYPATNDDVMIVTNSMVTLKVLLPFVGITFRELFCQFLSQILRNFSGLNIKFSKWLRKWYFLSFKPKVMCIYSVVTFTLVEFIILSWGRQCLFSIVLVIFADFSQLCGHLTVFVLFQGEFRLYNLSKQAHRNKRFLLCKRFCFDGSLLSPHFLETNKATLWTVYNSFNYSFIF